MNNVMVMTDAVVARGQRAWGRIKATAAEQRELWREVGEALLVGRRLHKSDKLFGQRIKENGFGDMDRRYRADSMWLAEVSRGGTVAWPDRVSDPKNLREWFNEQKTTSILPFDLEVALLMKGYDVEALRSEHLNSPRQLGEKT